MAVYRVPLTSTPQEFTCELGGVEYVVRSVWNAQSEHWEVTLAVAATGAVVIASQPLVTGGDLLGQHLHLGVAGKLVVTTDGDTYATPTLDNLGSASNLYFVTS